MKETISIGIAEDHPLLRQGLTSLLKQCKDLKVLFEVGDGKELLGVLKILRPDVLLLDFKMPVMSAPEVLEKVRVKYSKMQVIIISAHFQKEYIIECFKLGAKAFLSKDEKGEKIVEAIYSVHKHGIYTDTVVAKILANELQSSVNVNVDKPVFSKYELEILHHVCKGLSRNEIAAALGVKPETVSFHMGKIRRKTNITSTGALISYAINNKLVS